MNSKYLGQEITRLRKNLSMTQKQLCEGICTQPTISMIEKGDIIPRIDILILISSKLNKPFNYFIDFLLINDYEYIHKFVNDIEEFTLEQQFNYVYQIVSNELANPKYKTNEWFNVFLRWQLYLSSYYLGKLHIKKAISQIKKLYYNTPSNILHRKFLGNRIINTLAFLYALKKDFKKSLFYFNKINFNISNMSSTRLTQEIYYLRILYNKTKTLFDMGNYQEALAHCKKGINLSLDMENMSNIGNFYFYLGECYEKLNYPIENIVDSYKNALYFFKLLQRNNYIEILLKEKGNFIS